MQTSYVGLSNQAATCYMNSYLQFLYMTKQFRGLLFSLHLKPEKQENEKDSIPYQLQKLFCKLNLKLNKMLSTKNLTTSFQWGNSESFYEHDICEFGKMLFEAISISLSNNLKKNEEKIKMWNFFKKKFEGQGFSSLKCLKCLGVRKKKDLFTEINLVINNEFRKLKFRKLETSLLNIVSSDLLDGDNKVNCEKCEGKQDFEKSYEFTGFPELLVFNLNRFVYDYKIFDRVKIDDYFEFPLLLDMDNFLGNLNDVEKKTGFSMKDAENLEKNSFSSFKNSKNNNIVCTKKLLITKKGKKFKNKKTSKNTRDFLKNMRKVNKNNIVTVDILSNPKQLNEYYEIDESISENKSTKEITQTNQETKFEINSLKNEFQKFKTNKKDIISVLPNLKLSKKNSEKLTNKKNPENDITSEKALKNFPNLTLTKKNSEKLKNTENRSPKDQPKSTNLILNAKVDNLSKSNINNQEFLIDKDNIYSLYTVFIHKGNAHSGHYYVYIKSFETHFWYLFDDYQVKQVNIADVLKDSFGGHASHSSAYMLVYKKMERNFEEKNKKEEHFEDFDCKNNKNKGEKNLNDLDCKNKEGKNFNDLDFKNEKSKSKRKYSDSDKIIKVSKKKEKLEEEIKNGFQEKISKNTQCPEYLKNIILEEMKKEKTKKKKIKRVERKKKHRIHFELKVKFIEGNLKEKFCDFEKKCFEKFGIKKEDFKNVRLRLYNRFKDEMLDVYEDKKDLKLSQLKFKAAKNLIIELKKENEEFENFNPNMTNLKIVFWNQNADNIDWVPKYDKITLIQNSKISDLMELIRKNYPKECSKFEKGKLNLKDDTSELKIEKKKPVTKNQNSDIKINIINKKIFKNGLLKGENYSLNPNKTLNDLYLTNQTIIYIDFNQEESDWIEFFKRENNKIIINFNYPHSENSTDKNVDYNFKIKIDINKKLKSLKKEMKKILNLNLDQDFIIKKGGISGIEFKDQTKIVRTLGIINNSFLYLKFGRAISLNEIKVNIFVCLSELSEKYFSLERDNLFIKEIIIDPLLNPDKLLSEIAEKIPDLSEILENIQNYTLKSQKSDIKEDKDKFNQLISANDLEVDQIQNSINLQSKYLSKNVLKTKKLTNIQILNPLHTRIREKNGNILIKCYKNISMKQQRCTKRKKLILELYKPILDHQEILIYYTTLNCEKFQLSPIKEIIINKRSSLWELGEKVKKEVNLELEFLEATKIRDVREFIIEDLIDHRFFNINDVNLLLPTAPFYVDCDGCLFMFFKKF